MGVAIHNPWIRSAPSNTPVLAMFMQINNPTDKEIRLVVAHAEGYKRVEIHRTINDNGMMKMARQSFAPIAAGKKLHFKPGSWHIMLIGPEQVPSKGSLVPIKLEFDNGMMRLVDAYVKSGEKMHMDDYEHQKINFSYRISRVTRCIFLFYRDLRTAKVS